MSESHEKSRSQVKREFRQLKDLGIQLAGLSEGQLRAIPLSEDTREAMLAAHGMARNALQRHYRYLASLLAKEDVVAIRAALTGELRPHADDVERLHKAEELRDQLLSADADQLAELVGRFPENDRPRVLLLVRNARDECDRDQPPRSARQLFRYLKAKADVQD